VGSAFSVRLYWAPWHLLIGYTKLYDGFKALSGVAKLNFTVKKKGTICVGIYGKDYRFDCYIKVMFNLDTVT
jgi:hypothetical protein